MTLQIIRVTPMVKRYPMPKRSPVPSVTLRELTGADEVEAARMADALLPADEVDSAKMIRAERQEAVRVSITHLGDDPVDPAVPAFAIDKWPRQAARTLERFFSDINDLETAELELSRKDAEPLWDEETGRAGQRFKLPARCSLEVVEIWEIGGNEEIAAALRVDAMKIPGRLERMVHRRREMVRAALRADAALDFNAMSARTLGCLQLLFDDVNGIPEAEIQGCLAAAVDLSGAAPAEMDKPQATGGAGSTG